MQKGFQRQRTRSTWRKLSTTICVLSLIGLVQGCATQTVAEAPKEIPQTLLAEELPSWKAWFESWLTLVQSAADCISGAPPTTTLSQP